MFAHGQYFDACTNDKPLSISLLHELPIPMREFGPDRTPELPRPWDGGETGGACAVVSEIDVSVALCMWMLPWLPALGMGGMFALFVWVTVTPLTRHTKYAPLLHTTLVFSAASWLRRHDSVFVAFHVAACVVYTHYTYRSWSITNSYQRYIINTGVVVSVGGLILAFVSTNEVLQVLNVSVMVLIMVMFSLK